MKTVNGRQSQKLKASPNVNEYTPIKNNYMIQLHVPIPERNRSLDPSFIFN